MALLPTLLIDIVPSGMGPELADSLAQLAVLDAPTADIDQMLAKIEAGRQPDHRQSRRHLHVRLLDRRFGSWHQSGQLLVDYAGPYRGLTLPGQLCTI